MAIDYVDGRIVRNFYIPTSEFVGTWFAGGVAVVHPVLGIRPLVEGKGSAMAIGKARAADYGGTGFCGHLFCAVPF